MEKLNEVLRELGISKVKLAAFLGVSRQMIYNYLDFESINQWPKDKKVLLLNLLGVKSADEIDNIKVNTDYISAVDERLKTFSKTETVSTVNNEMFEGLKKRQKELLIDIINVIKEKLEEDDDDGYNSMVYLYHFLQSMDTAKELKYILGYISKSTGFTKPLEFVFDKDEQFIFESILFSAFSLYEGGGASKTKLAASHERFVAQIEHKMEEKMSRTMELNSMRIQALKELGYTEINSNNAAEVFEKIAEIQSRKVTN